MKRGRSGQGNRSIAGKNGNLQRQARNLKPAIIEQSICGFKMSTVGQLQTELSNDSDKRRCHERTTSKLSIVPAIPLELGQPEQLSD